MKKIISQSMTEKFHFKSFSGLQIHDTCNRKDLTQKHLYKVIATIQDLESENEPPVLGNFY